MEHLLRCLHFPSTYFCRSSGASTQHSLRFSFGKHFNIILSRPSGPAPVNTLDPYITLVWHSSCDSLTIAKAFTMDTWRAMISKTKLPIVTASHVVKVPKSFLIFRSLQLSLALLVLGLSIYGTVVMTSPLAGVILSLVTVSRRLPGSTMTTANRPCSRSARSSLHHIRSSLLTETCRRSITTGSYSR